eukprot:PhM_4_TR195/c0_g1_i1/m.13110
MRCTACLFHRTGVIISWGGSHGFARLDSDSTCASTSNGSSSSASTSPTEVLIHYTNFAAFQKMKTLPIGARVRMDLEQHVTSKGENKMRGVNVVRLAAPGEVPSLKGRSFAFDEFKDWWEFGKEKKKE